MTEDRSEPLDTRTRIALGAMSLAVFVIANDITSLSVALPRIEHDFGVDVETVQWVMNAYTLVFGVLIVTGGRLSDILGRRRTFFIGVGIFAACSAVGGRRSAVGAVSTGVLIAARAAMAIGAALIWPSVVGIARRAAAQGLKAIARTAASGRWRFSEGESAQSECEQTRPRIVRAR